MTGVETERIVVPMRNGKESDTSLYLYGSSVPQTNINLYESHFAQMKIDAPEGHTFIRTNNPGEADIIIEDGVTGTNPDNDLFITPLGEELHPVYFSTTTMGVETYFTFAHEMKQAVGMDQVGYSGSVLKAPAIIYSTRR